MDSAREAAYAALKGWLCDCIAEGRGRPQGPLPLGSPPAQVLLSPISPAARRLSSAAAKKRGLPAPPAAYLELSPLPPPSPVPRSALRSGKGYSE